jgi:hypothetical protein
MSVDQGMDAWQRIAGIKPRVEPLLASLCRTAGLDANHFRSDFERAGQECGAGCPQAN